VLPQGPPLPHSFSGSTFRGWRTPGASLLSGRSGVSNISQIAKRLNDEATFLKTGHVAVRVRGSGEDPVDIWLRAEGRKRNITIIVPHYLQALHAVARSDLIAVIPERLIRAYATSLHLKWCPLSLDAGTFDEFLLHPARTHADPGCIWLRDILKEIGDSLSNS
jgi:DNA-binding transcriptional LysR family regulator